MGPEPGGDVRQDVGAAGRAGGVGWDLGVWCVCCGGWGRGEQQACGGTAACPPGWIRGHASARSLAFSTFSSLPRLWDIAPLVPMLPPPLPLPPPPPPPPPPPLLLLLVPAALLLGAVAGVGEGVVVLLVLARHRGGEVRAGQVPGCVKRFVGG